ncbi:MAG: NUDIX hydrolase [Firmicutes bacterium]|nr:NUDIX hydrolase [Bacillota bacterium]
MERSNGESQVAFRGRVLSVRVDPVVAKSGPTTREVVERPSAVAIVAETDAHEVVVIRQFRWAVGQFLYELPAGVVDPGEAPLAAAKRELAEETGYRAREWAPVYHYFVSPGYSTEVVHLYQARSLTPGEAHGDPDEDIQVELWTKSQAIEKIRQGFVQNGILLMGLQWWLKGATGV